ncbi:MAG TPA: hypothetical protein VGN14_14375 [Candidatus Elarobacter sp.]
MTLVPPSSRSGSSAASTAGLGSYGDGSDGVAAFDGATTVAGMVPAANVYTMARDYFFTNATLATGVTIVTNGFRLFVAGTLTGAGTALIQWNGQNASGANGAVGGAGLSNANSSINTDGVAATASGGPGANGGTGNGAAGTNLNMQSISGNGGAGGTGAASTAGAGGTVFFSGSIAGSLRTLPTALLMSLFFASNGTNTWHTVQGGGGGGAGGGDATNNGGGGGAGGGTVGVYAKTFAGSGAIQARGGNGGNVTVSGLGAGGGGGGGGGLVIAVSQSVVTGTPNTIPGWTIDANGGAAGAGHGTTFGAAVAGSVGAVILIPN